VGGLLWHVDHISQSTQATAVGRCVAEAFLDKGDGAIDPQKTFSLLGDDFTARG
jgi:hypothetical protein